jgi:beta-lactamase class A
VQETLAEVSQLRIKNTGEYKFINPLIGIDYGDEKDFVEFRPLREELDSYIIGLSGKKVTDISVYFRDLTNGHWVGINENSEYDPASLYKLPIMIAYLQKVQSDPKILLKRFTYESDWDILEEYSQLEKGKSYTTDELIRMMIVLSDNGAKDVLVQNIDSRSITEIFSDLGIRLLTIENKTALVSAKSFSLFFRILYNTTYLNRGMSEYALKLLSEVEFKEGLQKGVSENIVVAHKFGDYGFYENGKLHSYELHDCGIIYKTDHPYFLCVMTKGFTPEDLKPVIGEISKIVFEGVDRIE